ncbi:MAG: hypothetical protein FD130_1961 [Halothiobacillaceae bacterium]|nr:MAG: hypothetical protein FD130_1961 [Halothiobacillaceae bacterium]
MRRFTFFTLLTLLAAHSFAAEPLYIQSIKAKLLTQPSFASAMIREIPKGEVVELIAQEQQWLKVRYQSHEGWLPKLVVGSAPPLDKKSLLDDTSQPLTSNARRRASESSATAAARGLRDEARARDSDAAQADFNALKRVDDSAVSDHEAQEFIENGNKP